MKRKRLRYRSMKNVENPLKNVEYIVNKRDCHVCTSHSTKSNGYPRMRHPVTSKMTPVQRVVYEKQNGEIPDDKVVVRTCGNKRCMNPEHLELRDKKKTLEYLGVDLTPKYIY